MRLCPTSQSHPQVHRSEAIHSYVSRDDQRAPAAAKPRRGVPPGGSWGFPGTRCRRGRGSRGPSTRGPWRIPCANGTTGARPSARVVHAARLANPSKVMQHTINCQRALPDLLQAHGGEARGLLPNLGLPETLQTAERNHTRHGCPLNLAFTTHKIILTLLLSTMRSRLARRRAGGSIALS